MRAYTELITEITIDGETFIPIKKIAALAFGYRIECIDYQLSTSHNTYFEEVHLLFSSRNGVDCRLHIDKELNLRRSFIVGTALGLREPVLGQVEIFKLLTKWGFI